MRRWLRKRAEVRQRLHDSAVRVSDEQPFRDGCSSWATATASWLEAFHEDTGKGFVKYDDDRALGVRMIIPGGTCQIDD